MEDGPRIQNNPKLGGRRPFARKLWVGVAALILLLACLLGINSGSRKKGKPRLPVGNVVPAISIGSRHGLILASDGSLWTWGSDNFGWPVLGLGNSTHQTTTLRRIGQETDWVSISTKQARNLALKADGTLWIWGVSVPPPLVTSIAINTPQLAASGHDWKQAAAGGVHVLAVKRDGTLWGWGDNWAGSVGIGAENKGSATPVQIGQSTNWTKVWASTLESVGQQADGSLWYWGVNPNPNNPMDKDCIAVPTRVNSDTNWLTAGFGDNTVFAIKTDGTLWAWGRNADAYTGASDPAQNAVPSRVGTDSDWLSIGDSTGWWCQLLSKIDRSLWLMDASEGLPLSPKKPYKPVRFKRVAWDKDYAVFAGGSAAADDKWGYGSIGVALTPQGEVWTWGLVLGDPMTVRGALNEAHVKLFNFVYRDSLLPHPRPVFRDEPWLLRNE